MVVVLRTSFFFSMFYRVQLFFENFWTPKIININFLDLRLLLCKRFWAPKKMIDKWKDAFSIEFACPKHVIYHIKKKNVHFSSQNPLFGIEMLGKKGFYRGIMRGFVDHFFVKRPAWEFGRLISHKFFCEKGAYQFFPLLLRCREQEQQDRRWPRQWW